MIIVRSVSPSDIDQLWALMGKATYGLTTLQISKKQLCERLDLSHFAFQRETDKPAGEPYVFVMEDRTSGRLIGVSSIFSKTGGYEPFYSYRRVIDSHYCKLLGRTQTIETLHLTKIHDGPTEIGSLFLDDSYRGQGRGRLLSLIRFAYMSLHRQRFADEVIVELRGAMSKDGISPFWEGLGRLFFDMDFPQADMLSTVSKRFIEDWFPRYPIYVDLLSETARQAMGSIHENSKPAFEMLRTEGFQKTDMIDIFDGGATLCCSTDEIRAIQRTRRAVVGQIADQPSTGNWLEDNSKGSRSIVAVSGKSFRGMLAEIAWLDEARPEGMVRISQLTAATLGIQLGQSISVTSLHPEETRGQSN